MTSQLDATVPMRGDLRLSPIQSSDSDRETAVSQWLTQVVRISWNSIIDKSLKKISVFRILKRLARSQLRGIPVEVENLKIRSLLHRGVSK